MRAGHCLAVSSRSGRRLERIGPMSFRLPTRPRAAQQDFPRVAPWENEAQRLSCRAHGSVASRSFTFTCPARLSLATLDAGKSSELMCRMIGRPWCS